MRSLLQDIRFGLRMLLKKPGFTLVAVLALALGIGANSAVFSVINAILLKPLPVDDPQRIVALWEKIPNRGVARNEASVANYLDWRAQNSSFENLAIYTWWSANLGGIETPERVRGFRVSPNLLDTVGIKVAQGRNFLPTEDQPGKDGVTILSHGLWQRGFGADPKVIGRTVMVNGVARTIVGVMPENVTFPRGAEILAPMAMPPEVMSNRGSHGNLVIGRLKNGVSIAQAQSDLDTISNRLVQQYPKTNTGRGVGVFPIVADTVREFQTAGWVMMGAVGFVLLIACANVANLMLARSAGRMKEVALRLALGASRGRIIRQLLTESLVLSVLGGVIGVLLALWGVEALKAALPEEAPAMIPGFAHLGVNSQVLVYTLLISLVTGVLFGLAPAIQASKPDLNEALKEGASRGSSAGRHRLSAALVVSEIALSLTLLVGAGLLIKNFLTILKTDPGFKPDNVLTMGLSLPSIKYKDEPQRRAFFQEFLRGAQNLPGVESVAMISHLPLGGSNSSNGFLVEGVPDPPPGQEFEGRYRTCSPDYFKTMGVPILQGRGFSEADTMDSQRVIIVNETMAKQYWPKGDAIGKHMRFTGPLAQNPWMEVVGVVGDVKHEITTTITTDYYLPLGQDTWSTMFLVARTQAPPLSLVGSIRNVAQAIDRDQPVFEVNTMVQVRDRSIMHFRLSSVILGIFGVFAMILASTGIYGVMAYAVSQRTREIGVRMALGAQRGDMLRLILGQGMLITAIGVGVGLLGAYGLTRALKGMLFGVSATDWMTFIGVATLLTLVSLLACYIPARRASKVDPMIALRYE